VASGAERGVQACAYRDGVLVESAAAGVAEPTTGRAMTEDTPVFNWSIGKALTATLVHVLVAQGRLTYDTPVAAVWPEFAAHGKDRVTVRHALSQAAGVPAIPPGTTPELLGDWAFQTAALADARPWWEPGTALGYHAYSFGFLLGEVVRRVAGTSLRTAVDALVAGPLGVRGELWFGVPAADQARLAVLEDAPGATDWLGAVPDDAAFFAAVPRAVVPCAALGNRPDVLAADLPAGAKVTARAIARVLAALTGEVDGVRLVPPDQLAELSTVAQQGEDRVFGAPDAWALGHMTGHPLGGDHPVIRNDGAGGSAVWADLAAGEVVAVTKNRMRTDDDTVLAVARALHA
jgi:CubicO group peptidase (beta-lactamase class C family)